ncbi:MAG: MFS transporter [Myxococcota bacterium]
MANDLLFYMASRAFAGAGGTMIRSAIAWHLYTLTGSAFDLGLMGAIQFGPALLLALPAGLASDRFERRRIIQVAQAITLVATGALAGLTFLARVDGAAPLFATLAVLTGAAAFSNPARSALLPLLVSRAEFPRVVTTASTIQALAFALGPALTGVTVAAAGIAWAYVAGALLVGGSIATLMFLSARPPAANQGALSLASMLEGLHHVRGEPVVLGAMSLDLFAVLLGGATALLPVYANDVLGVGASGYGVLSASLEVGALATAVVLLFVPPIRRVGRALLLTVAAYGLATIAFGLSTWFPLSVVAYAAAGMADQVSVVLRQTTIQLQTPDHLRGRVSSVSSIFIGASNQLSAVESGFVAAATSAPFAVVSGGVGVLVVVAVVALGLPALRRYELERPGSLGR